MKIIQEEDDKDGEVEQLKTLGKKSLNSTLNRLSEEMPKAFSQANDEIKEVGDEIDSMLLKLEDRMKSSGKQSLKSQEKPNDIDDIEQL